MDAIFNQYSYVLISLGVLFAALLGLRFLLRARWRTVVLTALPLAALLVAGNLLLRPGASDVGSLDAAEAVISNGQPTFVEFYSNYCIGCINARAAVDELVVEIESQFADAVNILRVDIHTDFGRILRERYGFSYTPEFVIFDNRGSEVWRSHAPPSFEQVSGVALSSSAAESAS